MIGLRHRDTAGTAIWTAPTTIVVGAGQMTPAQRDAVIADRWFRTRPHLQAQMAARSDLRRFSGAEEGGLLGALARSVRDFAAIAGQRSAASVWEIDQRSGLIRHTELTASSSSDHDEGEHDSELDAASLRERDLSDWDWQSAGLIDPVAALLAPEVTDGVGWTTLAPASGATPTRASNDARRLTWSGQGDTFSSSRRSAVLEGIERLVGAQQASGACLTSPAALLSGRAILPTDYDAYPDDTYGTIVERFDPGRPHEWVAGRSLHSGQPVWIPREFVYYAERPAFERWALGTSSGCATGSSTAEATVFGLLEHVERDTFVNAWYGEIPAIPVDPDSIPGIADMVSRVHLLGWSLQVGLLRNAWRIPMFVAVLDTGDVRAFGAAAHLELDAGARRAITEAVTYAPARADEIIKGTARVQELRVDPRRAHSIEDHPLLPVAGAHPAYATMCGDASGAVALHTLNREVDGGAHLLARAGAVAGRVSASAVRDAFVDVLMRDGIETFAVVQTAPFEQSLGLSTVMTLAPQLSQLDFGWAAQRVCTSRRPLEQRHRLTGTMPSSLRDLPHPFS